MNIRIIIHDNENMTLQVFYMLHEINQIEFKHKKKSLKMIMVQKICTGTQCQKDREILDIFVGKNIDEQCWVGDRGILVCMYNTDHRLLLDVLIYIKFFPFSFFFIIDKIKVAISF